MDSFQNQFPGSDVTLQRYLARDTWLPELQRYWMLVRPFTPENHSENFSFKTILTLSSLSNCSQDLLSSKCLATEFPKDVSPNEQPALVCAYTEVWRCKGPGSPQVLCSWYSCDFCLSVCICFGSFDYKLFIDETVHYQTYIHKWTKLGLSECTRKMFWFFFRLHNLSFSENYWRLRI